MLRLSCARSVALPWVPKSSRHIASYPGRNGDLCSEKRLTQMMSLKRTTPTLTWMPGAWKPSLRQVPCDDLYIIYYWYLNHLVMILILLHSIPTAIPKSVSSRWQWTFQSGESPSWQGACLGQDNEVCELAGDGWWCCPIFLCGKGVGLFGEVAAEALTAAKLPWKLRHKWLLHFWVARLYLYSSVMIVDWVFNIRYIYLMQNMIFTILHVLTI